MSRWPRWAVAYAIAAFAAVLAVALPLAEVTRAEDARSDAGAGRWVGIVIVLGVTAAIVGSTVRRRRFLGAVVGAAAIMIAVLLLLVGGLIAAFGVELVIEMWDSDAGGRGGPGRIWAVIAVLAALTAVVLDLSSPRSRQPDSTRRHEPGALAPADEGARPGPSDRG